jgi:hypothetical protein
MSVCPSVSIYVPTSLSIRLSVHLTIYRSLSLFICLSLYVSLNAGDVYFLNHNTYHVSWKSVEMGNLQKCLFLVNLFEFSVLVTKFLKCFSSGICCTGGWLCLMSGLDGHVEETVSSPTGIRTSNRRARIEALYQLRYPGFRSSCSVRSFLLILTKLPNGRRILWKAASMKFRENFYNGNRVFAWREAERLTDGQDKWRS